jgi:hypothetical protein
MFIGGGGGQTGATTYAERFQIEGLTGFVDLPAIGAFNLLITASGQNALAGADMICYFRGSNCGFSTTETDSFDAEGNQISTTLDVRSSYGGRFSVTVGTTIRHWAGAYEYATTFSPPGGDWGTGSIIPIGNIPAFHDVCSGSTSNSYGSVWFPSFSNAITEGKKAVLGYSEGWSRRAPLCLPFSAFSSRSPASVASDVMSGVRVASSSNADPNEYFTFTDPISFQDPGTGGGGGDTGGDTGTGTGGYVPGDDSETSCKILDLFCWTRWAFVPKEPWGENFSGAASASSTKVPFGWVGWLQQDGGLGDFRECNNASLGLDFSTAGCSNNDVFAVAFANKSFEIGDRQVTIPLIDIGRSAPGQWWLNTGRVWLLYVFQGAFFFWLIKQVIR